MTETIAHIRRLFLKPKDTYSEAEAAEILGMDLLDVKRLFESGEVEGVRNCSGMTVSRKELISFAMDHWAQDAIEKALGEDVPKGIPKLLRLADLHVRIPRFEIVALERLAERDGRSIDAVLTRELLDIVSAESDYLSANIPGFAGAVRWPARRENYEIRVPHASLLLPFRRGPGPIGLGVLPFRRGPGPIGLGLLPFRRGPGPIG